MVFLERPISAVLFGCTATLILFSIYSTIKKHRHRETPHAVKQR